jgi:hypothetical protein
MLKTDAESRIASDSSSKSEGPESKDKKLVCIVPRVYKPLIVPRA